MKGLEHQKHPDLLASFPWQKYPKILDNQKEALEIIAEQNESVILELPTGSGKTAIGYAFLKALLTAGKKPLFYITPNKTLVNQVKEFHPDVKTVYGRNEYRCLYYKESEVSAEDSPCSFLNCPHRVNQETGETQDNGVEPCPYLLDKYRAKQGGIVVCTTSFYLFTRLFSKEWGIPAGLVIDEAHRIARVIRNSLSYEITDYHLERGIELLREIKVTEAGVLDNFLKRMVKIIKKKSGKSQSVLLESREIRDLLEELNKIDIGEFERSVRTAIKESDSFSSDSERDVLKRLETIVRNLTRYYRFLEYSLPSGTREPLNYTYGYCRKELKGKEKVKYKLFIKAYYVAPIVKKILSPFTVAYSATIGDPEIFSFETGIEAPFYTLGSDFPVKNTRIFMPKDTPNLALKTRGRREPTQILRKIAKTCKQFSEKDIRSLVVVISNKERNKFLELCEEEEVKAISYGNGIPARIIANRFKNGEGDVLVGTAANYGEGIDLPKSLAPVIFFLRPGYPSPNDPATIFEERRFRGMRWGLWNWRVMIEALQVRGRNIRSAEDVGVTFFVSQQFRRFLLATLPEWMEKAYIGNQTLEKCVNDTLRLL